MKVDFTSSYRPGAVRPWDIHGPQPAFARLQKSGKIGKKVLDVGCGTGELVLYLASLGHQVVGLDSVPTALAEARGKAKHRGLKVKFVAGDALDMKLKGRFDTVLDSGLFHIFGPVQQRRYLAQVARLLKPGGNFCALCFSDRQPGEFPPSRMRRDDFIKAFRPPWKILSLSRTLFRRVDLPPAQAWILVATNLTSSL